MKKHIHIIAALILTALVSCQQNGETTIEFDLTDIPEGYVINLYRVEGRGGNTVYQDSSKTTDRKFTFKCDSLTENTSFEAIVMKDQFMFYSTQRKIYVQEGSTSTVSGSGIAPSKWTVKSKNPHQAFYDKMYEPAKDLYKEVDNLSLEAYKATSDEERDKINDQIDEIFDKISEKNYETMATIPVDDYLMEELGIRLGGINYEGKNSKFYDKVVDIYNRLPDNYKASKTGKALYHALYGKAPAVGDHINDYDLYDADGKLRHLADFKGKWLLLDFSSYYCGPCRIFDAAVKYLYERGIGKDFEIITITADLPSQFAEMVAAEKPIHPLFNDRDGGNGLFALNKISATPTYYVVDPDGVIKEIFMGVDLVKIIGIMKEHGGFAEPSYTTENGATVVNNPKFEDINSTFLIDRIEIYKDSTVAHCTNPMPGAYMIATNTGFFANGKCISKITKCDIGFDQYVPVPFGEVGHCRLTFEPLPKGTKTFDLITGDCETCFRVLGLTVQN